VRRASQLAEAAAILLAHRRAETPVLIARNLGRSGESWQVAPLGDLAIADIDMLTILIVGNSETRITTGMPPRLYTPRGYGKR
jgi:cobalt-precorrin 5A hydrolase/precorrin-3B C17-methyltransferase